MSKEKPNLDLTFDNHFRGSMTRFVDGLSATRPFQLSNEAPEGMTEELEGRTQTFRTLGNRAITATMFNEGQQNLTVTSRLVG